MSSMIPPSAQARAPAPVAAPAPAPATIEPEQREPVVLVAPSTTAATATPTVADVTAKVADVSLSVEEPAAVEEEEAAEEATAEATPTAAAGAGAAAEEDDDEDDDEDDAEGSRLTKINSEWLEALDKREHMNVVLIGHVDAGKSTTSGNILYLTGMVDQRTIDKFEREAKTRNRDSWFMAFIMDTNEEERAKGKTVEVGRAYFTTENRRFTVLDAPGHKNYVPNMIQGASQADIGILVISARRGEFEAGFDRSGQTREHAMLAKTLGVTKLIVAINKMDEPTVQWNEERYNTILKKLRPFLKGCGYKVKMDVVFLPISGLTGDNVMEAPKHPRSGWYSGPTLLEAMDRVTVAGRDAEAPLRVPVLDRYSERGTIVMGKVESGVMAEGMRVVVMPTGRKSRIESIVVGEDIEVKAARPGENIRFKLRGLGEEDVQKGFVICSADAPCPAVHQFEAQVALLNLEHRSIMTVGYRAVLHAHTVMEECVVTKLISAIDPSKRDANGKPVVVRKPKFVKSDQIVNMRIRVPMSVAVDLFDKTPQLGRFTLRDEGRTIAIGKVIKLPRSASGSEE